MSQLSWSESYNFQKALYRIMMYCEVFHANQYPFIYDDDLDEAVETAKLQLARKHRIAFLSEFTSDELVQIHTVSLFLKDLAFWLTHGEGACYFLSY